MRNLAKRVIFQTLNDKRSVALILVAPLLILTLVYFLLGDSDYVPVVAVDASMPEQIVDALEGETLEVIIVDLGDPEAYLKKNENVDAVLLKTPNTCSICGRSGSIGGIEKESSHWLNPDSTVPSSCHSSCHRSGVCHDAICLPVQSRNAHSVRRLFRSLR